MVGEIIHHFIREYPLFVLALASLLLVLEGGEAPFFFLLYIGHEVRLPLIYTVPMGAALIYLGDILYFTLGPSLARWEWFQWFESKTRGPVQTTVRYPFFVLPVVRFAYGLWHPLMVQLRSAGLPFRSLAQASFISTSIWTLVLTALYVLALPAGLHYVRHIEVVISAVIVFVLILSIGFRLLLKRQFPEIDAKIEKEPPLGL